MYAYCQQVELFASSDRNWAINLFETIQHKLVEGEEVSVCFIGIRNKSFQSKNDGFFAYALTNKRFIIGQKKFMRDKVQILTLSGIQEITLTDHTPNTLLSIETLDQTIEIVLPTQDGAEIYANLTSSLDRLKNIDATPPATDTIPVKELQELKALFDQGILTEAEFSKAKARLLDL